MALDHTPCGIEIPQVFFDGPVDVEHIRRFVTKAETLGYDSLWLQERIIGDFAILEPVALLSYVAAITKRLRLGTSVILLTLRNPVQLAKSFSTLDCMSGGRAVLGIGLGGGHLGSHEEIFGYSRERRVTRFTEAVQVMKLLWTEPAATFRGTFWNFENVSMEPKPLQKPHIPLWFGGHMDVTLQRIAKWGDGWMMLAHPRGSEAEAAFGNGAGRVTSSFGHRGGNAALGGAVQTLLRWKLALHVGESASG
jgi:probable F420-dependent oxidoreductase